MQSEGIRQDGIITDQAHQCQSISWPNEQLAAHQSFADHTTCRDGGCCRPQSPVGPRKRPCLDISTCVASSSSGENSSGGADCCTALADAAPGWVAWTWQPEFVNRITPAPAAFLQAASLVSPLQRAWSSSCSSSSCDRGSDGGHGSCSCSTLRMPCQQLGSDIVCALEFTRDGRFLASAGVAKQVSAEG